MIPDPMIGPIAWCFARQLQTRTPAPDPARTSRDGFWSRFRPLAFLAPLAVNWPGGKMAL